MRLWLKEIALVAVVTSALNLLDGELFYLAQVRGAQFFRQISLLLFPETNISNFVGAVSNILSVKTFDLFKEQGVFGLYLIALSLSALIYFKTLERFSKNPVLSLILAILGMIGVVSNTKDLSIALAVLLCSLELFVLSDSRIKIKFLIFPLMLIHFGIDASYLLSPAFYFVSLANILSASFGILLLLNSAFIVVPGGLSSPYSSAASLLLVLLGLAISLRSKSLKLIFFSILIPLVFFAWEEVSEQRFPALAYFTPFIVTYLWASSLPDAKSNFTESLNKLEQAFNVFFTAKNKIAFFWLCLAFIFFQTATKFMHPVNEAYLPKEALDIFTEARPTSPPFHPIAIGGYVGFRLAPLLSSKQALNYLDLSAKTLYFNSGAVTVKEFQEIFNGANSELFNQIAPKTVLCQGRDKLCTQLKADDHWKILSHSTLGDKILQKLGNLPAKQKEYVTRKLEEESWYLLASK